MQIKIIFDSDVLDSRLAAGWGFSCLIDGRILFDTGEKPGYLFNNMKFMGIDTLDIEAVVISHEHWDHSGGLWGLLKKRKRLKVYSCPGFSRRFKDKVLKAGGILQEADEFTRITDNTYVTGEIPARYKGKYIAEQAFAIQTESGIVVITGCCHPGIIGIIERVREGFPKEKIKMVFGGFHLMDKDKREVKIIAEKLKGMGVKKIGPAHCTGHDAQMIFKQSYGDKFLSIKAGQVFEV